MTYQNQVLDFEFYLTNEGDKFADGSTIKKIDSPRSLARIETFGGHHSGEAQFTIWGLSFEDIATLTRFRGWNSKNKVDNNDKGNKKTDNFNTILVKVNGNMLYQGTVVSCIADLNQAPDVSVSIHCNPIAFLMTLVAKPFSFKGEIKAADMIESIIKPLGMSLTNVDVDASLTDPYIVGSPYQQILQIINHVGCFVNFSYDDVYISKQEVPRDDKVINLSPNTGLIGYPMYYDSHLVAKSYYSPIYAIGKRVKLDTILPLATGEYKINSVIHDLSCNLPGGKFETTLVLIRDFTNAQSN